jgi:hypothetical protein
VETTLQEDAMPTDLRSQLDALAARFAREIDAALHTASPEDLLRSSSPGGAGARRQFGVEAGDTLLTLSGRLVRRSEEGIEASLDRVVDLVRGRKKGMRAEEIRTTLDMLPQEMPRILREGVRTERLASRGRKRAKTYFAT